MSEEIRVGDRFLLEVEVVEDDKTPVYPFRGRLHGQNEEDDVWLTRSALLAAKRLPRPLRVGDRVKASGCPYVITAIRGDYAWCHYPDAPQDSSGARVSLADLTLAEESAS